MTTQRPRPTPPDLPAEDDPWVEAVRRALVTVEAADPASDDQRAQAARTAERGVKELGAGIDPNTVLASLERFAAALRLDPSCVDAYLGIGRAVQLLASRRPRAADPLYTAALEWLERACARHAPVQAAPSIHALEERLLEVRANLRARPRPASNVEADAVRLERDSEGRAKTRSLSRFRTPSDVLHSLFRARLGPDDDAAPRGVATGAIVIMVAVGLLLAAVVGVALTGEPEPPAWSDPALAAQVQEGLAVARPLLALEPALIGEPPGPAVVVADAGDGPALPDPLQTSLPPGVLASGPEVRGLAVVRRYEGPAGHLLLVWIVDLEAPARVVARAVIIGKNAAAVDLQASAWLAALSWRRG